jgi:CheY-like chemotaxis protein
MKSVHLSSNDFSDVGRLLEKVALLESKIAEHEKGLVRAAAAQTPPAEPRELELMLAEKKRVESIMLKVEALNVPTGPLPFPVGDREFVIMSIDDDLSIRHLLKLRLELKGCAVVLQENGPAALQYLDDPSSPKPDLIICDVMMPGMDGYETCRRIRAKGIAVPYIFLTSKGSSVDKVRGLEAGADDYILKPFDPHELEAKVARHLRKK